MNRRSVLQATALIGTTSIAGCLSNSVWNADDPEALPSASTHRPPNGTPTELIRADYTDNSHDEAIPLTEFESSAQRELAIAITRLSYSGSGESDLPFGLGDSDFALSDTDLSSSVVEWHGEYFRVRMPVGEPEPNGVELVDPFELELALEDDRLTVEVVNRSEKPYEVNHYGRPYHGILVAWDGEPHILKNDYYTDNEAINVKGDFVYPDHYRKHDDLPGILELKPEESIKERYTVPNNLDAETTIWMDTDFRESQTSEDTKRKFQTYVWDIYVK
ncbi:hypothetical protein ACFQO4_19465 [Saliphagus sp. GCM10025334]|uniref:hypothetical protein n=1 Tax=Natronosalvus caseinilyticus TaxID=2953747 RepID=UPI0028A89355|nr:hypothetical protein [Natronosalvus caseinilyticus]